MAEYEFKEGGRWSLFYEMDPDLYTFEENNVADSPGTVTGPIINYGDIAESYGFKEEVAHGAFGADVASQDWIGNFMHQRTAPLVRTKYDGGLEIWETDKALMQRSVLPNTQLGQDTAILLQKKVLRGLSVEFYINKYSIDTKNKKVTHTQVRGIGFGYVDKPAFKRSIPQIRWEQETPLGKRRLWL